MRFIKIRVGLSPIIEFLTTRKNEIGVKTKLHYRKDCSNDQF
jgi:hypothetical protein